jgi:cytochrome b561
MKLVSRYHWLVVLLHWLLAFYIIATLAGGFLIMAPMAGNDPEKKRVLLFHMSFGLAIAGVMLLRLVIRLLTAKPAEITTGHAALDRLVPHAHYAFYVLIVLQAATGLATAILAGLNRSVFQGTAEPLPADFSAYPSFTAHAAIALLLSALILIHVVAVLYHQFVRRDRLLRRMWFGRRKLEGSV